MKVTLDTKFKLIDTYDLEYVYLAVYLIGMGRVYLSINANAMRAGARVDRPDQQVYKVMDPNGKSNAPYVLLANVGWAGKFNRAQRAAFNTDEGMAKVLVETILVGCVFGPIIAVTSLLGVCFRIKYALGYTEAPKSRRTGIQLVRLVEGCHSGLVLLIAIKATAGSYIPF